MVSRHMALVGDALSHVALPGVALGILFNFNPFIGAFAFLAATVIVTWYLQKSTTLSVEAIIGGTIRFGTCDRDSYHPRSRSVRGIVW